MEGKGKERKEDRTTTEKKIKVDRGKQHLISLRILRSLCRDRVKREWLS